MSVSLKAEILEKLLKKQKGLVDAKKASKQFYSSDTAMFREKPKQKRHQLQVMAGLKAGDKATYEGKQVLVQSLKESSGLAVVKLPRMRDPKIVRICDLKKNQNLTEGMIGIAAIAPTYRDVGPSAFMRGNLSLEDIGFDIVSLREEDNDDDDDGKFDDDKVDNGGNVRHDGHEDKKEVDELPTPSDTIATAYDADVPPKEVGTPLAVEPGFTVAGDPDLHGYDYPADAPEIPKADFADTGNSRSPHWTGADDHNGHFFDDDEHEGTNESTDEYGDENGRSFKKNKADTQKTFPNVKHFTKDGHPDWEKHDIKKPRADESFNFIYEMDGILGHEVSESGDDDTITLTLPALASVVCTVATKMGGDQDMMKAMIEALADVGKTIDTSDLDAVASKMNDGGCDEGEVDIETGPSDDFGGGDDDFGGGDDSDFGGSDEKHSSSDNLPHTDKKSDGWPGDGDKTSSGKTKLMGGVAECGDDEMAESLYYSWDDMVAEHRKPTYEEELREMKRRAGLRFW